MKSGFVRTSSVLVLLLTAAVAAVAQTPLSTAFTYQGQLKQAGTAVDGLTDFVFKLYDGDPNGLQIGPTLTFDGLGGNPPPVAVSEGLFTVWLDFGSGVFTGVTRWLEISVRAPSGSGGYTTLSPRQELTAVPYALYALNAAPGSGWSLNGNTGTDPNTDFLGTTDNVPLVLRANGLPGLRIEPGVSPGYGPMTNVMSGSNTVTAGAAGATVLGGLGSAVCRVTDEVGTVGGGIGNRAGDDDANPLSAPAATVGGGWVNVASGQFATVSGGASHQATAYGATVAGGTWNEATAMLSTVSGGDHNKARGALATVPGGYGNEAAGLYSLAAGRRAKALNDGAFVWADGWDEDFSSTGFDQFLVRAHGGVGINTNAPESGSLTVNGLVRSMTGGFKLPDGTVIDDAGDLGGGSSVWSADGNGIHYTLGNVGIGSSSSSTDGLRVYSDTGASIRVGGNGEGDAAYLWLLESSAPNYEEGFLLDYDGAADALRFQNWAGGSDENVVMTLERGGDVGIGTSTPDGRLQVSGPSPGDVFDGQVQVEGTETTGDPDTGGAIVFRGHDGSIPRVWATIRGLKENVEEATSSYLSFTTRAPNGVLGERIHIDSRGNVGIGTSEPLALQHVQNADLAVTAGALNSEDLLIESADAVLGLHSNDSGDWGSRVNLAEVDPNGALVDTWSIARLTSDSSEGPSALRVTYGANANPASNTDILTIDSMGNVGIGTTNPAATLHGVGDGKTLALEGTTHAYIEWYPDGVGAGRKGWMGYGSSTDNDFTIKNDIADAQIQLLLSSGDGLRIDSAVRVEYGSCPNLIAGHATNFVAAGAAGAVVLGASDPNNAARICRVTDDFGTVGGGIGNTAGDDNSDPLTAKYATVGGGRYNVARATGATVGGGAINDANGLDSTVGGGSQNEAYGSQSTVAGGWYNLATGANATVAGGSINIAKGICASVPGGLLNQAGGDYSFAAGFKASVRDPNEAGDPNGPGDKGTFVWADSSAEWTFESTGPDRFMVRASGGTFIYSDPNLVSGVKLTSGSSTWATVCDRNAKENLAPADGRLILECLAAIPLETWNYKAQDASIRHIGPMAQDFRAAFAVGEDDVSISTIDADGVALAAIQGLYEVVQEKDAEIAALRERLEKLETQVQELANTRTGGVR